MQPTDLTPTLRITRSVKDIEFCIADIKKGINQDNYDIRTAAVDALEWVLGMHDGDPFYAAPPSGDPNDLTPERRRELVLAAIDRIKHSIAVYRDAQLDPYTNSEDRIRDKEYMEAAEREFAWQWRNVEALLRGE